MIENHSWRHDSSEPVTGTGHSNSWKRKDEIPVRLVEDERDVPRLGKLCE